MLNRLFTADGFWMGVECGEGLSYLEGADHWKFDYIPVSAWVTKIVFDAFFFFCRSAQGWEGERGMGSEFD